VLLEPEAGASFDTTLRLKLRWYRRLQPGEKLSLYVGSRQDGSYANWWASETDILLGGGAIYPAEGGVVFEVNYGLDALSKGEAFWRVCVVGETATGKWQVSPWSDERQIYRVPWPGKRLGTL
jgi:hypothetical protein